MLEKLLKDLHEASTKSYENDKVNNNENQAETKFSINYDLMLKSKRDFFVSMFKPENKNKPTKFINCWNLFLDHISDLDHRLPEFYKNNDFFRKLKIIYNKEEYHQEYQKEFGEWKNYLNDFKELDSFFKAIKNKLFKNIKNVQSNYEIWEALTKNYPKPNISGYEVQCKLILELEKFYGSFSIFMDTCQINQNSKNEKIKELSEQQLKINDEKEKLQKELNETRFELNETKDALQLTKLEITQLENTKNNISFFAKNNLASYGSSRDKEKDKKHCELYLTDLQFALINILQEIQENYEEKDTSPYSGKDIQTAIFIVLKSWPTQTKNDFLSCDSCKKFLKIEKIEQTLNSVKLLDSMTPEKIKMYETFKSNEKNDNKKYSLRIDVHTQGIYNIVKSGQYIKVGEEAKGYFLSCYNTASSLTKNFKPTTKTDPRSFSYAEKNKDFDAYFLNWYKEIVAEIFNKSNLKIVISNNK